MKKYVTKNIFAVNYENLQEVIDLGRAFANSPGPKGTVQYVTKHPDRTNYNLTMQYPTDPAVKVVWRSDEDLT